MADAGLKLAHYSGFAKIAARWHGGAGVFLKFEHVRPMRPGAFQPLKSNEITPKFLDRAVRALKRSKYDFVSIDEALARAQGQPQPRRFVCLTFDGGHKDFIANAYPVLSKHNVPFAVYVPTAFIDGIGQAWWLALEKIVAQHSRIGLMIGDVENYFSAASVDDKYQVFDLLYGWLRNLSPPEREVAVNDLCSRYGVPIADVSRNMSMNWDDIAKLARDPLATIASATVNYPNLSATKGGTVSREMAMGRTVLESALGRECRHFAYPFGDRESFGARDILLAREAGFISALSSVSVVVREGGHSDFLSLPRIAWDGRRKSTAALRAVMSGLGMPRERLIQPDEDTNYG